MEKPRLVNYIRLQPELQRPRHGTRRLAGHAVGGRYSPSRIFDHGRDRQVDLLYGYRRYLTELTEKVLVIHAA